MKETSAPGEAKLRLDFVQMASERKYWNGQTHKVVAPKLSSVSGTQEQVDARRSEPTILSSRNTWAPRTLDTRVVSLNCPSDTFESDIVRPRQQGWTLALLAFWLAASQPALPQAHGSQGF